MSRERLKLSVFLNPWREKTQRRQIIFPWYLEWPSASKVLGSISAALSCLVFPIRERSAGSFPEQRLVIEPTKVHIGSFWGTSQARLLSPKIFQQAPFSYSYRSTPSPIPGDHFLVSLQTPMKHSVCASSSFGVTTEWEEQLKLLVNSGWCVRKFS